MTGETYAEGRRRVIVLDLYDPDQVPDYETRGRTECFACDRWVWLGRQSFGVVLTLEATAICTECAETYIPAGTPRSGHVDDT